MAQSDDRRPERDALIAELETGGYLTDPRLEEAMLQVPRHKFIPEELQNVAYEDRPLPVGYGQTVSAPHMVAMMTAALQVEPGDRVLEIGTGVGYHAAVLAAMVGEEGKVTTIEYLEQLATQAKENLKAAESPVEVQQGDGVRGHEPGAPYDCIIVTCAIPAVPAALIDQLREGGHFVAPIGITRCELLVALKKDGELEGEDLGPCLFVNAQGTLGELPEDDDDDDDDDGGLIAPAP